MARPKSIIPTVDKRFCIESDLLSRMELELFSDVEGRIPFGSQSAFINSLIRKFYKEQDEARKAAQVTPK